MFLIKSIELINLYLIIYKKTIYIIKTYIIYVKLKVKHIKQKKIII